MFRPCSRSRPGNILVMTALLLSVLGALLAFAVDLGYLATARAELQRSADAAAIAATWELANDPLGGAANMNTLMTAAKTKAASFAALNTVCHTSPLVDTTATGGDVVFGYLPNPSDPSATFDTSAGSTSWYNAVQVRVRRTSAQNGDVPLFFAHIFGIAGMGAQAQGTAAILRNISGFKSPSNGTTLGILPFALDKQTWDDMLAGGGTDNYKWDPVTKTLGLGGDGVHEVNLYPQGTGSPGNRGTVDIGSSNNSTADLARQIVYGVNAADMAYVGGELKFDSNNHLYLNGDTGISAGVKDELASIIGQPRIIPIFDQVTGPGNNASYQIVAFAGVRILDVKLTGSMSSKRVMIQPAQIFAKGAIPGKTTQTSYYVYSPAWLVR